MIYLYAITGADADMPPGSGLGDEPLRRLSRRGLAALYSAHEQAGPRPDPEALWRHDQVIEAAMERGPVLPVRFGTTLADVDALTQVLEGEAHRFLGQLERVRGCVELAVRVGLPPSELPAPISGRDYMQLRLNDRRAREDAADRTLMPLAELAMSTRRPPEAAGGETLKASYLVREHEVERFADQVRKLQDRHLELSLSCTGPWPPYSFVDEEPA